MPKQLMLLVLVYSVVDVITKAADFSQFHKQWVGF